MPVVYARNEYAVGCSSYEETMTFSEFRDLLTRFVYSRNELVSAIRKLAPRYSLKADRTLASQDYKTYMRIKTAENVYAVIFIDMHELGIIVFVYFVTPSEIAYRNIGMLFPWRSNWKDCAKHILDALHIVMPDKGILPRCAAFYEMSRTVPGFMKP